MRERQFTLRKSMAVIAASGCALAWVRSLGSFEYALTICSHSMIAWGLCFGTSVAVARVLAPSVRGGIRRAMVWGVLAIVVVAALYLAWGHHRAMYMVAYGLDHAFPYPDPAINALALWFDARRPAPPGLLKLHGEYRTVGFVLGMLTLIVASLTGLCVGVLSKRREGRTRKIGSPS
jgi:hypothetical protein